MPHKKSSTKLSVPSPVTRRDFLTGCVGCAAAAACVPALAAPIQQTAAVGAAATGSTSDDKTRIRLVFAHIPREKESWPYKGYDYEGRKRELSAQLREACPNVEWLPATVQNADETKKLLASDGPVDGYLLYLIGIWSGAAEVFTNSGHPILLVDDNYGGTGEFLIEYAAARRKGLRVAGVSSSRFEDVAEAVKAFEALKRMRTSVILDVIERQPSPVASAIETAFGTQVRKTGAEEINSAYRQADRTLAKEYSDKWLREARKLVEPTQEEVEKSAVIYVGMRDLMKQHHAQAITIDCLTLFYGGKLPAYPCLGFFQLNNDGLVGACEADLESTVSMLLMGYLVGRPGYISDPVIDTSLNRVIYAHCVAPNKVFGSEGRSNPYEIRSHSEDRKGAAIRSMMPLGEIVTTLRFNPASKEVIIHQGKTVENIDDDKACRSKLAVEVRDIDKLLGEWDRWGWHRVTFYGDHKRAVETVSALAGFKLIWES